MGTKVRRTVGGFGNMAEVCSPNVRPKVRGGEIANESAGLRAELTCKRHLRGGGEACGYHHAKKREKRHGMRECGNHHAREEGGQRQKDKTHVDPVMRQKDIFSFRIPFFDSFLAAGSVRREGETGRVANSWLVASPIVQVHPSFKAEVVTQPHPSFKSR